MIEFKLSNDQPFDKFRLIFYRYLLIMLVAYLISVFTAPGIWAKNVYLIHSIMEIICIFIAVFTFLIIWNSSFGILGEYQLIGYGFLAIAVFDVFHTYYFIAPGVIGNGFPYLSAKYWMVGRLVEAVVLLIVSNKPKKMGINKWLGLFSVLLISSGISMAIFCILKLCLKCSHRTVRHHQSWRWNT